MNRANFYIKKYIFRSGCWIFGFAFFLCTLFFVVSLFNDSLSDDLQATLIALGLAVLAFLVSLLPVFRFQNMIKLQERMFNIQFIDEDALPIHRYSLVYLTKDWLIVAGRYAFYRNFIRNDRIKIQIQNNSRGNDYFIKIDGVNNQFYRFHADSASSAKKIKAWSKTEESIHDIN